MQYMFKQCDKLKEIKGILNFNTFNVKSMCGMFEACKELKYLDLSNFNIFNVNTMENMFFECRKLKKRKSNV